MIGNFYLEVVQVVLLFGMETWVAAPWIAHLLWRFHHRVERRLVGIKHCIQTDGIWDYPPIEYSIKSAGL